MGESLKKGTRVTGNERSKLAAELKKRYDAGESIRSLSAATGRSYGFIHRILTESGVSLRGRQRRPRRQSRSKKIELTVQIYVEETEAGPEIEQALLSMLYSLGGDSHQAKDPVIGSWYRNLKVWVRRTMDSEVGSEGRYGLEMHLLDRFQAGIDRAEGDTVAKLITSLNASKGAVVQVGSVLLVKVDETLLVRQLTVREMAHWQRNPELFKDPAKAMEELQRALRDGPDQETPPALPETG